MLNPAHRFTRRSATCGLLSAVALCAVATATRAATDSKTEPPQPGTRFSEEDARSLIAAHGFYMISRLILDVRGAWRGTAVQYGRTSLVEIDARGQFSSSKE